MTREHKINISRKECIGCGMCVKDCPVDNIAVKDKKAVIKNAEVPDVWALRRRLSQSSSIDYRIS